MLKEENSFHSRSEEALRPEALLEMCQREEPTRRDANLLSLSTERPRSYARG